jgi:hypothetical protein
MSKVNSHLKTAVLISILFLWNINSSGQDTSKGTDSLSYPVKGKVRTIVREKVILGKPEDVFAFMDNIDNTGKHMTKTNAPMMGSKLGLEWLTDYKTGLGAKYRWRGKAVGMKMDFTVLVTKWSPGKEKIWESVGEAKMIVISWYRMFLVLTPLPNGTTETELGIYYTRPRNILGFFFGRRYSVWCVKSMLKDTKKHFAKIHKEYADQ